ncbi:EVE domain-containing protein [Herbidospora sp. NBRC 101105]|uniref:EVE domain-containing protein n=1 Tax=Herbidospora sp. NBRC 101105 TaxID=3032195 RepID=UPI0024A1A6B2|nr:EVE domain-containing protein [Herbidospora sp. NBRC 101105]GLX95032.1 hypothetical protein Hesp01_29820 [Herbidospora sp. NBRC 101105]
MRYWLLTWNPKTFDLAAARRDGQPIGDWRVGRFRDELQVGDRFLFWRSGSGGIAALGRIGGVPVFKPVPSPDYWTEVPEQAWFVPIEIEQWLDVDITFGQLRADKRFEGMGFIRMPGAANPHPVTEAQWEAFMSHL